MLYTVKPLKPIKLALLLCVRQGHNGIDLFHELAHACVRGRPRVSPVFAYSYGSLYARDKRAYYIHTYACIIYVCTLLFIADEQHSANPFRGDDARHRVRRAFWFIRKFPNPNPPAHQNIAIFFRTSI